MNSSARTLTSKSVAMYHSSAVFLRLISYVKHWTCRSAPLDTNGSVLIARRTNVLLFKRRSARHYWNKNVQLILSSNARLFMRNNVLLHLSSSVPLSTRKNVLPLLSSSALLLKNSSVLLGLSSSALP